MCDDTDAFLLLLLSSHKLGLICHLAMEATISDTALIDIAAFANKHANVAQQLLLMHWLFRCDTVTQLFGVGKAAAIKILQARLALHKLGDLDFVKPEVIIKVTKVHS